MTWYNVVFIILLHPFLVLGFLALCVAAYSSIPAKGPSAEELEAYQKKVLAELDKRHSK